MKWFSWLNKFSREKIALLIAVLALGLGALSPWYDLPAEAVETFGASLALGKSGQLLAAVLAGMAMTAILLPRRRLLIRFVFWLSLIATLGFPYAVTNWCPTTTFLATSYYEQGDRVTRHVETTFSEVQSAWKQNITLNQSVPVLSIVPLVIQDYRFFQFSSWNQWVEALGYRNAFWQGIGSGWTATLFGIALALAGIYVALPSPGLNTVLSDLSHIIPATIALTFVLTALLVLTNGVNYQLDTWLAQGQYQSLLRTSHWLESIYPVTSADVGFLRRKATAEFYHHQTDDFSIAFAKGVERYQLRNLAGAEAAFRDALAIQPHSFLTRGYLTTTLMNQGVQSFNNRNPGTAAAQFEQALQVFPAHTEALYDLMIARTVNGELQRAASVSQQIIQTQKSFQIPGVGLLGQAYVHLSWSAYREGNDINQAWNLYRKSVDKSAWNE